MRELRLSVEKTEMRALRAELAQRGRELADKFAEWMPRTPPTAIYDLDGRLVRPAPPADARRFVGSMVAVRDVETADAILEHGSTSAARAQALIRKGYATKDTTLLRRALDEKAVHGTDLS